MRGASSEPLLPDRQIDRARLVRIDVDLGPHAGARDFVGLGFGLERAVPRHRLAHRMIPICTPILDFILGLEHEPYLSLHITQRRASPSCETRPTIPPPSSR